MNTRKACNNCGVHFSVEILSFHKGPSPVSITVDFCPFCASESIVNLGEPQSMSEEEKARRRQEVEEAARQGAGEEPPGG